MWRRVACLALLGVASGAAVSSQSICDGRASAASDSQETGADCSSLLQSPPGRRSLLEPTKEQIGGEGRATWPGYWPFRRWWPRKRGYYNVPAAEEGFAAVLLQILFSVDDAAEVLAELGNQTERAAFEEWLQDYLGPDATNIVVSFGSGSASLLQVAAQAENVSMNLSFVATSSLASSLTGSGGVAEALANEIVPAVQDSFPGTAGKVNNATIQDVQVEAQATTTEAQETTTEESTTSIPASTTSTVASTTLFNVSLELDFLLELDSATAAALVVSTNTTTHAALKEWFAAKVGIDVGFVSLSFVEGPSLSLLEGSRRELSNVTARFIALFAEQSEANAAESQIQGDDQLVADFVLAWPGATVRVLEVSLGGTPLAQPTTTTTTTPLPPTSRPGRSLLITAENGVFLCKIPAVNASGLPLNPSSSNTCKPVALSSDAVQNPPAGLTKPFRSIQADNGDIIVVDKDNARIQRCPLVGPCFTVAPLGNMTLSEPRAVQLDEAGRYVIADSNGVKRCDASSCEHLGPAPTFPDPEDLSYSQSVLDGAYDVRLEGSDHFVTSAVNGNGVQKCQAVVNGTCEVILNVQMYCAVVGEDGYFFCDPALNNGNDDSIKFCRFDDVECQDNALTVVAGGVRGSGPTEMRLPHDVLVDETGSFIVADSFLNNRIQRCPPRQNPNVPEACQTLFFPGLNFPTGLAYAATQFLPQAVSAGATTVPVADVGFFVVGDTVAFADNSVESKTVTAVSANSLTLDSALANGYSDDGTITVVTTSVTPPVR